MLLRVALWPAAQRPGFILLLVRKAGQFSSGPLSSWARVPLSSEGLWCWLPVGPGDLGKLS